MWNHFGVSIMNTVIDPKQEVGKIHENKHNGRRAVDREFVHNSEAGGSAGPGGRLEGGLKLPGSSQGRQLEEIGESRAGGSRPGAGSLTKSFGRPANLKL